MKNFWKRSGTVWGLALLCVVFAACGNSGQGELVCYRYADTHMGTLVQQSICAGDRESADEVSGEIARLLDRLESQRLSWRLETSEVYAVNQTAGSGEGYLLTEEMTGVISECVELWKASGGAFDVAIGTMTRLWNLDAWAAEGSAEGFVPPDRDLLRQMAAAGGTGRILLEPEVFGAGGELLRGRLFLQTGARLDLGAVGKGYALDLIRDCLDQKGISGAAVSVGGSVLICGTKPDGSGWRVGVVNPLKPAESVGVLTLEGQWCVSTSGDYQRYVEADGVRFHHILDPATGMPADSGVRGVTILTERGLFGDGLSTACFVLGVEKGMELARSYGAEALFVTDEGELVMTPGMKKYFREIP